MKTKVILLILLLSADLALACENQKSKTGTNPLEGLPNTVILDWNLAVIDAMGGLTYEHVMICTRAHAMMHIAMHDALNAIFPVFETYQFHGNQKDADPIAATASAAHTVLVATFPDKKSSLDQLLEHSLADVRGGKKKEMGITLGVEAANAILDKRSNDNAFHDPIGSIDNPKEPGVYQYFAPFDFVYAPEWKTMQTFALSRFDQFRSAPPVGLTSATYTKHFEEVKAIGGKNSTSRTPEQTAIAKFWYEASEIGWNRIARIAAKNKDLDLVSTTRLFALLNMALMDSYIAGFDSKFYYNFWRPVTAIHDAETDGNPKTNCDPAWESLEITPPVPDYPSTHSVLADAGAQVLSLILGDNNPFIMESSTSQTPGETRSFLSYTQAADENAESRVLAGLHFRFSCQVGQEMGQNIGKWTVENFLKPVSMENTLSKMK